MPFPFAKLRFSHAAEPGGWTPPWIALLLVMAALWALPASTALATRPLDILCLHSYGQSAWTDEIMRGYRSVLGEAPATRMTQEYMDTKRVNTPEYLEDLYHVYARKYRDARFDLILTSDDCALRFALRHKADLFHDAPVVFCGVNHLGAEMLAGHPDVTGVLEQGDFRETLDVALLLRPSARTLYILGDTTRAAVYSIESMLDELARHYPDLHVRVVQGQTVARLGRTLATLPGDSIAFQLSYWLDDAGDAITPTQLSTALAMSSVPVFGRSEWMIGKGLTGGKCVRGFTQGVEAGRLAERVLDGNEQDRIPVVRESPNEFLFDYTQLKRHGLPLDLLPEGSILVNKPPPFYRVSKPVALTAMAFITVLLFLSLALGFNIHVRRQSEEALRRSESHLHEVHQHLESVLDNASIWLTTLDTELRPSLWNKAAEALSGYSREEAVGNMAMWEYLFPGQEQRDYMIQVGSSIVKERREVVDMEASIRCRSGETKIMSWSGRPITDLKGNTTGAVLLGRDVTERKKTMQVAVQNEKMLSLGGLAAGMAHEINNPLAAMLGGAQILGKRLYNDQHANFRAAEEAGLDLAVMRDYLERRGVSRMLEAIIESGKRAAGIVSNMLSFSRRGDDLHAPHDLRQLLDRAVELAASDFSLQNRFDFKNVKIIRQYDADLPDVACEASAMQQVFLNILRNGAEAMLASASTVGSTVGNAVGNTVGRPPRFTLRARRTPGGVLVEIEDTGPGLDQSQRNKVFEPFFTTKPVGEGTGLGLAVCYFIVTEAHGGTLEVDDAPGGGALFRILLPSAAPGMQNRNA